MKTAPCGTVRLPTRDRRTPTTHLIYPFNEKERAAQLTCPLSEAPTLASRIQISTIFAADVRLQ